MPVTTKHRTRTHLSEKTWDLIILCLKSKLKYFNASTNNTIKGTIFLNLKKNPYRMECYTSLRC